MFCGKCGAKVNAGAQFCNNCGEKLDNKVENKKNTSGNDTINRIIKYVKDDKKVVIPALVVVVVGVALILANSKVKTLECTYKDEDVTMKLSVEFPKRKPDKATLIVTMDSDATNSQIEAGIKLLENQGLRTKVTNSGGKKKITVKGKFEKIMSFLGNVDEDEMPESYKETKEMLMEDSNATCKRG